jgi:hypothetical protein
MSLMLGMGILLSVSREVDFDKPLLSHPLFFKRKQTR